MAALSRWATACTEHHIAERLLGSSCGLWLGGCQRRLANSVQAIGCSAVMMCGSLLLLYISNWSDQAAFIRLARPSSPFRFLNLVSAIGI